MEKLLNISRMLDIYRTKGITVDIRQVYRDCNAASHYLSDSLTTTKCKGPLRGKILVSYSINYFQAHQCEN